MHVEFTFFEWLTLYSLPLRGRVDSPTSPRLVTLSRWRTCEDSTLYLGNCTSNIRFWVINPLFLTSPGYGRTVNHSATCTVESLTYLWSFYSISWKLCECALNNDFWVVNPLFPNLMRYGRIVNLYTTSFVGSLTYLWSFHFISWKLCECTLNQRFLSD